jgi:four helix bundle protein
MSSAFLVHPCRTLARSDLLPRVRLFSLRVRRFCRQLPCTDEAREAAGQLRRAANGFRSNYRASRLGRSRAEFEAKLGVAREEADEALDWLEYLRDARIAHDPELLDEAHQLTKIMMKAWETAQKNSDRLKKVPKS